MSSNRNMQSGSNRDQGDVSTPDELTLAALGPPPLLPGESSEDFSTLCEQLTRAIGPKDTIEVIFVRDLADLTWEIMRLRHAKARVITDAQPAALISVVEPELKYKAREAVEGWVKNDKASVELVQRAVQRQQKDYADVNGLALSRVLKTVERMDAITASLESRRNNIIKEIERRRDAVARRAREAIESTDAEFTSTPKTAA